MKKLLIATIICTLTINSTSVLADTAECDNAVYKQVIATCAAYAKSLEVRITDRDKEITFLTDQHNKDVMELKKGEGMSPVVSFLIGLGTAFAIYGLLSAYEATKK